LASGEGLQVLAQPRDLGCVAFRVREEEHAGDSVDRLERERPLAFQLLPATLATRLQLGVSRLGLGHTPFGARDLLLHLRRCSPDLFIGLLEQLRQRQLNVRRNAPDLRESLRADLFKKWSQCVLVQPLSGLWKARDRREVRGSFRRAEVTQERRVPQACGGAFVDLHDEQSLVDDSAKAVNNPRPIEVHARGSLVLNGEEARTLGEGLTRFVEGVSPKSLEQRMAGRHPFQGVSLGHFAVRRAAWVLRRNGGEPPVRLTLESPKRLGCLARIESMGHGGNGLDRERRIKGRIADEAGDGLGDDSALLC
jgi:hypothetical protein